MRQVYPQPQRWTGQAPWSMEYWLFCNRLYNSLELADTLRRIRRCAIYYADGIWSEGSYPSENKTTAGRRQRRSRSTR